MITKEIVEISEKAIKNSFSKILIFGISDVSKVEIQSQQEIIERYIADEQRGPIVLYLSNSYVIIASLSRCKNDKEYIRELSEMLVISDQIFERIFYF